MRKSEAPLLAQKAREKWGTLIGHTTEAGHRLYFQTEPLPNSSSRTSRENDAPVPADLCESQSGRAPSHTKHGPPESALICDVDLHGESARGDSGRGARARKAGSSPVLRTVRNDIIRECVSAALKRCATPKALTLSTHSAAARPATRSSRAHDALWRRAD